ncbi:MAG: tetratricopeptide repeat protein, partial [Candidatus Thorarchaeota archaeon]
MTSEDLPIEVMREGARLWEQGKTHEANSDNQMAIDCYLEMMRITFEDSTVWNAIATCYLHMGDMKQCESSLRRALELEPDDCEALNNLPLILLDNDKPREAEEVARRAVYHEEIRTTAYHSIGRARLAQDRPIHALEPLLKAVRGGTEDAGVFHTLGRVFVKLHDVHQARKSFTKALELEGSTASILYDFGRFLIDIECYGEALAILRRAKDADPLSPLILTTLAEALIGMVKTIEGPAREDFAGEAMGLLNESLSHDVTLGKTWYHWGEIKVMFKDWPEVEKFIEASIEQGYVEPWSYALLSVAKKELGKEE